MKGDNKKRIIAITGTVILLIFLVFYIIKHSSDFAQLVSVGTHHFPTILLASFLFFILISLNGYLFNILLSAFDLKLPFREWCGLAVTNNFYNLITPFKGGMAALALYLKEKYGFGYMHYIAVQGAIQFFTLFTAALTVLICIPFMKDIPGEAKGPVFLLFFLGIIFQVIILIYSPRFRKREGKWFQRLINLNNGWTAIKGNKKLVAALLIVNFIQRFLKGVFLVLVYGCIGIKLDFVSALFISSVGMFSLIITLLPGNLGIDDAINIFSARLAGVFLNGAIAATLLGRMINLAVSLTLGPIFSYTLFFRKKTSTNNTH